MPLADLPERRARSVHVGDAEVMLYRMGDAVLATANRCTHQGAPLDRGVVKIAGSLKTVACPLHGSTFLLTDGRVAGDVVEVRPRT